jgi:hypothetical protein
LPREIKPAKHAPESALAWVAAIGLYTGMRLEEIAQLKTDDVREEQARRSPSSTSTTAARTS